MLMMEYLDLAIKRPATLLFSIMEKMFVVMGEVNVGPRPANISPIIQMTIIYCWIYLLLLVLFMNFFMVTKEVIILVIMEDMDLDIKIPDTILFKIIWKFLMVMLDVDIGIRPFPIPPTIQVRFLDNWFFYSWS